MRVDVRMDVGVDARNARSPVSTGWVRRIARQVLAAEGIAGPGEVSVYLVGDPVITELNGRYLGHPWPTDVIAFPGSDLKMIRGGKTPHPPGWVLGDVVVSFETAARQAIRYRRSYLEEVALLVVHGLLHLLGYSDAAPAARRVMRRKEREMLRLCEIATAPR